MQYVSAKTHASSYEIKKLQLFCIEKSSELEVRYYLVLLYVIKSKKVKICKFCHCWPENFISSLQILFLFQLHETFQSVIIHQK